MVTYHSRESMAMRFGRNRRTRPGLYPSFGGTFDVEGYIHYHGAALVRRFDANSYLYLTRAMDLYDVGRDGGGRPLARQIAAPMLCSGSAATGSSRPRRSAALADRIAARARTRPISSSIRRMGMMRSSRNGIS